ncbi:MAG: hypothetical protein S4CHLAM123_13480 [Chlamydiales bacterium]|nr:hypothetical protein [Chlamydiales bacterium]
MSNPIEGIRIGLRDFLSNSGLLVEPSGSSEKALHRATIISGVVLFIIAACAAGGGVSAVVMGGCTIGLSVPGIALAVMKVCNTRSTAMKVSQYVLLVIGISKILLGTLALAGAISAVATGWILILPAVSVLAIVTVAGCCCAPVAIAVGVLAHQALDHDLMNAGR